MIFGDFGVSGVFVFGFVEGVLVFGSVFVIFRGEMEVLVVWVLFGVIVFVVLRVVLMVFGIFGLSSVWSLMELSFRGGGIGGCFIMVF